MLELPTTLDSQKPAPANGFASHPHIECVYSRTRAFTLGHLSAHHVPQLPRHPNRPVRCHLMQVIKQTGTEGVGVPRGQTGLVMLLLRGRGRCCAGCAAAGHQLLRQQSLLLLWLGCTPPQGCTCQHCWMLPAGLQACAAHTAKHTAGHTAKHFSQNYCQQCWMKGSWGRQAGSLFQRRCASTEWPICWLA